jgi:hypothetical protein
MIPEIPGNIGFPETEMALLNGVLPATMEPNELSLEMTRLRFYDLTKDKYHSNR